ncbi:MAG: hypothetical protein ACOWWO_15030 [Peptococcaceae bacterium]
MDEMKSIEEIKEKLQAVDKRRKIFDWIGAGLIVAFVFWGVWFFQQPAARANVSLLQESLSRRPGNEPFLREAGDCCALAGNPDSAQLCGPGTGNCGLQGERAVTAQAADPATEAAEYYTAQSGAADVQAVITDYGCHLQADIYQDGQLVKSLGYRGPGSFYEIN